VFGQWASRWRVIRTSNAYVFSDPQPQLPRGLPHQLGSESMSITLRLSLIIAFLTIASALGIAQPQQSDSICVAFEKQGKQWCATQRVTINGPNGPVTLSPGTCFSEDIAFNGVDVAHELNALCKP